MPVGDQVAPVAQLQTHAVALPNNPLDAGVDAGEIIALARDRRGPPQVTEQIDVRIVTGAGACPRLPAPCLPFVHQD